MLLEHGIRGWFSGGDHFRVLDKNRWFCGGNPGDFDFFTGVTKKVSKTRGKIPHVYVFLEWNLFFDPEPEDLELLACRAIVLSILCGLSVLGSIIKPLAILTAIIWQQSGESLHEQL